MSESRAPSRAAGRVVLGFSGLAHAREFKKSALPGLTDSEQDIFQGADAAAALLVDGRVMGAAAEERYDRRKHSASFPLSAALFCLDRAGLAPDDIDVVAHSFAFAPHQEFYRQQSKYYRQLYDEVLSPEVNWRIAERALGVSLGDRFVSVPHHVAHAASAYVPSGFPEALVVVSDGLGERHSTTVLRAASGRFEPLVAIPAHSSLGLLYGLFTLYLGFRFGDGEYKVMGLAPHGDPDRYTEVILRKWLQLEPDGRYSVPLLLENVTDLEKETYRAALAAIEQEIGPRRTPDAPIEQRHRDVAAGLQAAVQTAQLRFLGQLRRETGLRRLCLAGGVALNCVLNGAALRSRLFDEMFVQPAAGDDGAALGAAFVAAQDAEQTGERLPATPGTSFGPEYSLADCQRAAEAVDGLDVHLCADDDQLVRHTAELIAAGRIVGWFQGRMEFGPRALGMRSILADPRRADMRDRVNQLVKKRESFRPFAPAVTEEAAVELFDIEPEDVPSFAHMLFVAYVRPEHLDRMPATTHVDASARVQTVARQSDPLLWSLLDRLGALTGIPVVLNTSFNVQGQPIVRSPEQAVRTFLDAGLDALAMNRMIITRTYADQH